MDLHALIELVRVYAIGVAKHRWKALNVAVIICLCSWPVIYSLPDKYEAATRIYVDTESVLRPLLRDLIVETNVMNDVSLITRTLMSRPQLERVIRDADLDLTARSTEQFEDLVSSVEARIELGSQGDNVYKISYTDQNRETALNVVGKLLDNFVGDTLGSTIEDSKTAEATLEAQISDYERRLEQAENRLKVFKQENVGLMPGANGDYYGQLQVVTKEAEEVAQKLTVAQHRLRALTAQLEGEEPIFGIMSTASGTAATATPYDTQINNLEGRLTDLMVEFTERHPEVVRVDKLLTDLRAKREKELADRPPMANINQATGSLDLNPVYQQLKIQHSTTKVDIASLRAELSDRQAAVKKLTQLVDVVPEVEARLNSLNRDYSVVKNRYETMLARWENLQTAKRVRSGTDELQFRIIDPPFAASAPVGPPRAMYVFASFVFACGAGVAVAIIFTMLNPVFSTQAQLRERGLSMLGEIALVTPSGAHAYSRLLPFIGAFAMLLIAAVLATAMSSLGAQIVQRLLT